jgi:hypothetical protein
MILVAAGDLARSRFREGLHMAGDSGGSVRKDGESDPPIQGERRARRRRADGAMISCAIIHHGACPNARRCSPRAPIPGIGSAHGGTLADPALQGML